MRERWKETPEQTGLRNEQDYYQGGAPKMPRNLTALNTTRARIRPATGRTQNPILGIYRQETLPEIQELNWLCRVNTTRTLQMKPRLVKK